MWDRSSHPNDCQIASANLRLEACVSVFHFEILEHYILPYVIIEWNADGNAQESDII